MINQGNSYASKNININKDRYINSNNRLGDRTILSHSVDGKRYFSSLDAEIYFGETYIDEIVQITWSVDQATMPLFGYNSYTFDDIAVGARQVSGSFVVNFTKSGFMYDVLKSVQAVNRASLNVNAVQTNDDLSWSSNFEKEHKASWDKSFNIRVGYGDQTTGGKDTTMTVIHCVQLTGTQQVIGTDGAPIAEVYTFIAKDIRYEMSGTTESNTSNNNNSSTSKPDTTPEFVISINPIQIIKEGGSSSPVSYTLKFEQTHNGGELDELLLTLKKDTGEVINTSAMSIGTDSKISYKVPNEYIALITRALNVQTSLGTKEPYLVCDFKIIYSIDGKKKSPIYQSSKKIYLKNDSTQ